MTCVAINLGLLRSGTTAFAKALRRAGLRVADHRLRQEAGPAGKGAFVADLLYAGYFATGDPLVHLPGIDAVSEMSMLHGTRSIWPQMDLALIRAIRAHHPGVKLVATWRDPATVSRSILAWTNLGTERLPAGSVPGLPPGYGGTHDERVRWIEGHYQTLDTVFGGDPDYLRLDVDSETARGELEGFLGVALPWWGRRNQSADVVSG